MEKKQNVPALRFPGFSGEWKERKIEDITGIAYGGGTPSTQYAGFWQGTIPWIQSSDVIEDELWSISPRKYISKEAVKYSAAKVIPKNSIAIITRVGVGKVAFLPFDYATSQDFLSLSRLKIDERFGTYAVWKKINADAGLVQGTSIKGITREEVLAKIIKVPVAENESKQVGSFFYQFDKKIGEAKRKIQKLQQFRQAMLTKLFPREGATEPELRFRGFSGKWRIRTLAKCAALHARIGWQNLRKSEFLAKGDYYLITGTDFVDGQIEWRTCHYVSKLRYDQDKNIQVQNGDILVTKDGTLGKVAYVDGADKPATLNAGVFNVKINVNDVDAKYLYQYLKGPYLMDYVNQRATGGTIKHLNQNILVDFPVVMPSFEEQKIIGDFFYRLDRYISLQQKKLERMQRLKAALLEKLFV